MSVRADSFFGRMAIAAQVRPPVLRIKASPKVARLLIAAGAQPSASEDDHELGRQAWIRRANASGTSRDAAGMSLLSEGWQPSDHSPEDRGADAADLLVRLAAGLQADLPAPAEYAEGTAALTLTPTGATKQDFEIRLRAAPDLATALAGAAILLAFQPAGSRGTDAGSDLVLFSRLDGDGVARFRGPGAGLVVGVHVPAQRSQRASVFTRLPELAKHAPAAAAAEDEVLLRRQVMLATPPVTVSAYETPDRKMTVSVEGLIEPEPGTALLVISQTWAEPFASWALPLQWSPALGGVRASLTIGRARGGLRWEVDATPVRLAELPAEILRRSQQAADERSSRSIAEILASRE
jgi:hypothetical protein